MKECFKCHTMKPLHDFYKHAQMGDGHLNKCKECAKSDAWHHRKQNIGTIRNYDKKRSKLQHRLLLNTNNTKKYREKFPERHKANSAVSNALRDGKLEKQPCFCCGYEDYVEAHHVDYDFHLNVIWLCSAHHREIHLAYPDGWYVAL